MSILLTALSTLLLGASKGHTLMSGAQTAHSPPVSPRGPPISQGSSSPLCRTPGLGCPVCGFHCSLPEQVSTVYSSFSSEPPPRGTGTNLFTFLPFLSDYLWLFLTALVIKESFCQFPVQTVLHIDVFLLCLWREVSFMTSYFAILTSLIPHDQLLLPS